MRLAQQTARPPMLCPPTFVVRHGAENTERLCGHPSGGESPGLRASWGRVGAPRYRLLVVDDELIEEAGRRLAEAAPRARVILFGSHARGDTGRYSDLDFLVVEPEVAHEGEESVRLRRALRGLGVAADVVVVSEKYVDDWRDVCGSLVNAALTEGRTLAA